jgi:hypothetical protein
MASGEDALRTAVAPTDSPKKPISPAHHPNARDADGRESPNIRVSDHGQGLIVDTRNSKHTLVHSTARAVSP